jgi:hypothetical protein
VSIPTDVDPAALVRCPLCSGEYTLGEALSLAPPSLIPVSLPPATEPHEPVGEVTVDVQHEPEHENEAAMAARQCPTVSAPARRRRKPKSALQTLIEVVLGGLAGCLVGYYALAFYFGPEFRDRGLPELPLPGISWLTASRPGDEPAAKPPEKKPEKRPEKKPEKKSATDKPAPASHKTDG